MTQRAPGTISSAAKFMENYLRDVVVRETNELPTVELSASVRSGAKLQLSSLKQKMRNPVTREIRMDAHFHLLWLDFVPPMDALPRRLWSFSSMEQHWAPLDYTEPYGFTISAERTPIVALAFFNDQSLLFVEFDLDRMVPPSARDGVVESVNLSHFVRRRFRSASWEPRFVIEQITRSPDGWQVKVAARDQHTTFMRIRSDSWIEVSDQGNTK